MAFLLAVLFIPAVFFVFFKFREKLGQWPQAVIIPVLLTLAYWYWESRAAGNIRVDLLLIYPFLFATYMICLWRRFKWYALLLAGIFMALNFGFFIQSYSWFNKYPG